MKPIDMKSIDMKSKEMQFPDSKILLFCKAPVPGEVKTRLIPSLGSKGACDLYSRLLEHALQTVVDARLCPLEIWVAPDTSHPFFSHWAGLDGVDLFTQSGEDLGMRMCNAAMDAGRRAAHRVLIGGDCPLISAAYLQSALTNLQSGYDAVLGPAEDGGYVLLGLNQCDPRIFDGIDWGTESVCHETCRRFNSLKWHWSLLEKMWDIDRPEDLARLLDQGPRHLSELLSS